MSNVLVLFAQAIIEKSTTNVLCYYESLALELEKAGNAALLINLVSSKPSFKAIHDYNKEITLKKISAFSPDVIIAFNNHITEDIIKATDCPIVVIDADSDEFFSGKDMILKYAERYYMATLFPCWEARYKALGFTSSHICQIYPATAVVNEPLPIQNNITFIGTLFSFYGSRPSLLWKLLATDKEQKIYQALQDSWDTSACNYPEVLNKYFPNMSFSTHDWYRLFDMREYILTSVLDLGLTLHGKDWDLASAALFSAYRADAKFSLQHNQDLYNTSIINLSVSHPQTVGYAFPWRAYDIMASSGVFVGSYSSLLASLTKGHVKLPMFTSPFEARELCKKVLAEPELRNEIVLASNSFIEKYGRWDVSFTLIEELTGVQLHSDTKGTVDILNLPIHPEKRTLSLKRRQKIFRYSLFVWLCSTPVVCHCIPAKIRVKALNRLSALIGK